MEVQCEELLRMIAAAVSRVQSESGGLAQFRLASRTGISTCLSRIWRSCSGLAIS